LGKQKKDYKGSNTHENEATDNFAFAGADKAMPSLSEEFWLADSVS
jgi:hypothetical protein